MDIPRSENIKKFSGKRSPIGVDPNLSRVYADQTLGSRYQFRLDRDSKVVSLIVHQSGMVIYPKGRSIPIGTVLDETFSLDLLVKGVPAFKGVSIHRVCQLIGSDVESLQTKAIAFVNSLDFSTPRKVKGGKAVTEKRARRSRRLLRGIEIR
jgi:hypothetical protein